MRIEIVMNAPEGGELAALRGEVERLRASGHEVRPRLTFESGDAARMAREAVEWGAEVVIAAGGDGTVSEVANGIHGGSAPGGSRLPRLGIVPLGTGNDLATALGIPESIEEAVALAVSGRSREIDVAMVGERCFLNASTGGIGAEATEEAPAEAKRTLGVLAYAITGVRKFVELRSSRARFTADSVLYEGDFLLYAVGNSDRTGGGNRLTPRADMGDGLLDVCIVTAVSRVELARLLPDLRAGRHLEDRSVLYRQVAELVVESEEDLSVNADGEPMDGCRRLEYRISPLRLEVAAGNATEPPES